MKILITDLDDTLLDWTRSFDSYIRDMYGYDGVFLSDNPNRLWDVLYTTKEEVTNIMKYHTELERFGNLGYYKDAKILNDNADMFDKILAVTSCGKSDIITKKRDKNVNKLFPVIEEVIYLDFLEQKDGMLRQLVTQYPDAEFYMIDDNIKDVKTAIDLGINAYAYRTAFHDPQDLPVVDSLQEFFDNIK